MKICKECNKPVTRKTGYFTWSFENNPDLKQEYWHLECDRWGNNERFGFK